MSKPYGKKSKKFPQVDVDLNSSEDGKKSAPNLPAKEQGKPRLTSVASLSRPSCSGFENDTERDEDPEVNCENEMVNIFKTFGTDFNKAILTKKRRLQSFTSGTIKANETMVTQTFENQLNDHQNSTKELQLEYVSILNQWKSDINQMKDHDEKITKIFQQQMKCNLQNRVAMITRLAACRQINENFIKKSVELDDKHREECSTMQRNLKNELIMLQKKMISDGQKEEVENMKKNLQNMFFM